ncbi:MAG: GyrI-like domain-containing protein [Rhodothermaceae bacterium]
MFCRKVIVILLLNLIFLTGCSSQEIKTDLQKNNSKSKVKFIELDSFYVTGISRIVNSENDKHLEDINNLWELFYQSKVTSKIEKLLSDNIYVIYSDYGSPGESDFRVTIGYKSQKNTTDNPELKAIVVDKNKYQVFSSSAVNQKALKKLYDEIEVKCKKRKYSFDFEVYETNLLNVPKKVKLFINVF